MKIGKKKLCCKSRGAHWRIKFILTRGGLTPWWVGMKEECVFRVATLQFLTLRARPTHAACFIFLVYRNNCETRHPRGSHPTASTTRPFCEGLLARKIPEASIVGATALRCILVQGSISSKKEGKKRKKKDVGPSLWNYVTVNWANTTGAPWPAGPSLHFACATGPLATWPEYISCYEQPE